MGQDRRYVAERPVFGDHVGKRLQVEEFKRSQERWSITLVEPLDRNVTPEAAEFVVVDAMADEPHHQEPSCIPSDLPRPCEVLARLT